MAEFRLSERAERDLIEIYDYTEETFGAYQADAYHAGLERTFDLFASFPRIGRAVDEIAPGFVGSASRLIQCFTPRRRVLS